MTASQRPAAVALAPWLGRSPVCHPAGMHPDIEALFEQVGCSDQLCVCSLDGSREICVRADQPAVSGSVFKVSVALEAETQFADGRLDPAERVVLPAAARKPGPVGFSLFRDEVEVSLRDLVVAMLTISDSPATDALLHRIGIDMVNASSARLGLTGTVIAADLYTTVNSIGHDAGFADWATMSAWGSQPHSAEEEDRAARRLLGATALAPDRATRTTAQDMVTLLRLIWTDQAGPASACRRVRQLMRQQLTKHRPAAAFPPPARVSAKSGGLGGIVRNEVGVIEYPDGAGYAAAVFTRADQPGQSDSATNAAIGAAAAAAVSSLADHAGDQG
jgi:beta-lactamase class A